MMVEIETISGPQDIRNEKSNTALVNYGLVNDVVHTGGHNHEADPNFTFSANDRKRGTNKSALLWWVGVHTFI
jgi:hypothetical protein